MRRVYVGDVHATVDELPECRRLVSAVRQFAHEQRAERVVWLGDLFNTMSTVRLEVLAFWLDVLLAGDVVVVGNHDMSNDRARHALEVFNFEHGPEIVGGTSMYDGILHVSYVHDPKEFVEICRRHQQASTVVCHQAFTVSRYEDAGGRNPGIYAGKEGVNPDDIPQRHVIGGHVHKPGVYGKVWHPGAPRWRIASDANEERAVWCVDHKEDGSYERVAKLDTGSVCRRIIHVDDTPERPANVSAGPMCDARVDVHGPTDYCRARVAALEARGVRASAFPTDVVAPQVRESDGLPVAWGKYLQDLKPARGTPVARVAELVAELYGLRAA